MDLAQIAFQWAKNSLAEHCEAQNISYDVDDVAYQLIGIFAEGVERDFREYVEEGAQQIPYSLMPGLGEYLDKQGVTLPVEEQASTAQEQRVRTLVEVWLDRTLGTYGLCYNFDTAYYDSIEAVSK